MKKKDIRKEYIARINEVISFVEKNLDRDLPLELLSKKAYFSPFHFHRIFSAITGETINVFVNRKRIERIAGIILTGTNENLTELAFRYGFKSGSSFSRAFKKFYGMSPTEFKTHGKEHLSKIGIEPLTVEKYLCSIDNILKWIKMNAQTEVKILPEINYAGITHIGDFEKIGETFEKLFKQAAQKGLLNSRDLKAITLYHDNPKITQMSKVRLSAGVTTKQKIDAEGELFAGTIHKGKYAVGRFEIRPESFPKAWDSMCIWVPENGYKFRDGDYFEIYHNDHKTHPEQKFIVDICIPVE